MKLKKGKLLKITILDEQESSVQSADKTKAFRVYEVEEIFIQHIKTWKLVIAASISDSLKINTVRWATLNIRATLNSQTFSMETH